MFLLTPQEKDMDQDLENSTNSDVEMTTDTIKNVTITTGTKTANTIRAKAKKDGLTMTTGTKHFVYLI
jgi:hypothetical protein